MVPSKILVPVDGSPASLRAVDFAIEMANQNPGTSLVLLNVQNIGATELSGAVMGSYDWQEKASQASAKALKEAIGKLEAAGAVFKTLVRSGQAAEAIAQVACEEDIQHIVMGTRGLGRIRPAVGLSSHEGHPLGSNSDYIDKIVAPPARLLATSSSGR